MNNIAVKVNGRKVGNEKSKRAALCLAGEIRDAFYTASEGTTVEVFVDDVSIQLYKMCDIGPDGSIELSWVHKDGAAPGTR